MRRGVVRYRDGSPVARLLRQLPAGFSSRPLSDRSTPGGVDETEVLVLDLEQDDPGQALALLPRGDSPVVALVGPGPPPGDLPARWYTYLPGPVTPAILARALDNAFEHARLSQEAADSRRELEALNAIGVRLSAERDTDLLLELILTTAREFTRSDAGSLYLVEGEEEEERRLRFKLTQNDTVAVPFAEFTMPVSHTSVAGHVALTGDVLRLADAYEPPVEAPFRINRSYDQQVGYRTKSMLVVPLRTPAGRIIGVLQLINCKREAGRPFPSVEAIEREALPYPARLTGLAASLASQAAVALENSRLYAAIQALFEGFVKASVTAIESRDPTTSGHSFRVAELTVALAAAADRADDGPFRDLRFSADEMKEIRYASLLHDFGKVGVREEVLVKAKKLPAGRLELIRQRVELLKRGLELGHLRRGLDLLLEAGPARYAAAAAARDAELLAALAELDAHLKLVVAANEPTVLATDVAAEIDRLARTPVLDRLAEPRTVVTPEEATILSIPRGSLTADEFRQIQSHVVHTYQFLSQIPWTTELRRVPPIARGHHEKLDGSGYPDGRRGAEIPIQTRMMTIADIFDALTASDRPYKGAVPVERALEILDQERRRGAVDSGLLDLFVATAPWERWR